MSPKRALAMVRRLFGKTYSRRDQILTNSHDGFKWQRCPGRTDNKSYV
jgi:hypothetical protein